MTTTLEIVTPSYHPFTPDISYLYPPRIFRTIPLPRIFRTIPLPRIFRTYTHPGYFVPVPTPDISYLYHPGYFVPRLPRIFRTCTHPGYFVPVPTPDISYPVYPGYFVPVPTPDISYLYPPRIFRTCTYPGYFVPRLPRILRTCKTGCKSSSEAVISWVAVSGCHAMHRRPRGRVPRYVGPASWIIGFEARRSHIMELPLIRNSRLKEGLICKIGREKDP